MVLLGSILWAALTDPLRILSYQQVIRAGQPLPSVGFVGSGVGLKKKWYCMHRGRCSCPSGTSYWYGVFIFQLNIFLLRERSGHPTLKFRNHFFIWLCYLHPLQKLFGGGSFARFGVRGIPTSHSYIFVFVTQTFGIKNHANPKFTSRGNSV